MRPDGTRHTLKDIYHETTNFDFLHRKWRWALLSGSMILIGMIGFAFNGLNLGIDFTGGTVWDFTSEQRPSSGEIRELVVKIGVTEPKIVIVGSNGVRLQGADLEREQQNEVTRALAEYGGVRPSAVSVSDVGPTWGDQVSAKALRALVVFFFVIAIYLSFRFTVKMAFGAIAAVLHDIVITIGIYAVTGFEVSPATVIAFLTILGFSLYDTVVVFDKIRENEPRLATVKDLTYTEMANTSLNAVLMRSLNTSFVALLPIASLLIVGVWIYGALALRDFGVALFVGIFISTYSSIFVATPILTWLKEREPQNRAVAERAETRAQRAAAPEYQGEPEAVERVPAGRGPAVPSAAPAASPVGAGREITPRPRQQRGKKRK